METPLVEVIRRTRQHHAIEHATIHLLTARFGATPLAGLSDPWGFTIYGDVPEEAVRQAASEALLRLQAGEEHLARHPNCGTGITATVLLVTVAALLGSAGRRSAWDKFLGTTPLVLGALLASQPLGMWLQRYTTLATVTDRWLVGVEPILQGQHKAYRVLFE